MSASIRVASRLQAARDRAALLLDGVGTRWQHTAGVAARAGELVAAVRPGDRELLVAAAWLHDIGYSPRVTGARGAGATGFHPLDGAAFLAAEGWPPRLCGLVANHSGAAFVARAMGLDAELARFPDERSAVTDALVVADQTTGPAGERMALAERMAGMLRRHGPDSVNAAVHGRRGPYLAAAADRVADRLGPVDLAALTGTVAAAN